MQGVDSGEETGRYLLSPEASKRTLADLIDRCTRQLCWWKEQLGAEPSPCSDEASD